MKLKNKSYNKIKLQLIIFNQIIKKYKILQNRIHKIIQN